MALKVITQLPESGVTHETLRYPPSLPRVEARRSRGHRVPGGTGGGLKATLLLLPLILLPLLPLLLPLPLPLLPYCCCCCFSRTPTKMDDDDFYYTTIPQRRLPRLLRLAGEFHWPLTGCYVRYHRRPESASGRYLGAIFGFCGSLRVPVPTMAILFGTIGGLRIPPAAVRLRSEAGGLRVPFVGSSQVTQFTS